MKRLLLGLTLLALVLPTIPRAEARTDISIDFFYDNLGDGGSWVEVGDYGYCWQPSIAVSNRSWRPYSDGYWAYTDVGWTWVSYEDFGWATYHYGRWIRLRGHGWVWVPGREWGPAWVSWRTGGDYVGWAPLPPRRAGENWDESPITARVDIDFDIGPAYYNFIDVRYIGEPVLRERIFAPEQNVTYITKTVNVTNITYTNSTVYNYGPDVNTLSRYSTRPIQRLSMQRETTVDPVAAAQSKSFMKVQGDKLVVAAPQQFQKPTRSIAPKVVKEKIAQAPVERGWEPVGDAKAQAELKQKMQKEDPKSVPPPTVPASSSGQTSTTATPAVAGASATPTTVSPATHASPATAATPSAPTSKDKDKGKDKRRETAPPAPSASVPATPDLNPPTSSGKNKNKRNDKAAPVTTPAPSAPAASVPPASTPAPDRDKGKNKQRNNVAPEAFVPPGPAPTDAMTPNAKEKPKKRDRAEPPAPSTRFESVAPAPVAPPPQQETKRNRPGPDTAPPENAPEKSKRDTATEGPGNSMKKEPPAERMAPPPGPAASAPVNPPPAREEGKKPKKNEPATAPTP
ncbi:MAG TPA: DUF6600 domain-containing protein [Chthoniobacterales bacterium]|nr:DUF6600 domain-containing protein [Chthoniobacterales bacterium]